MFLVCEAGCCWRERQRVGGGRGNSSMPKAGYLQQEFSKVDVEPFWAFHSVISCSKLRCQHFWPTHITVTLTFRDEENAQSVSIQRTTLSNTTQTQLRLPSGPTHRARALCRLLGLSRDWLGLSALETSVQFTFRPTEVSLILLIFRSVEVSSILLSKLNRYED